MRRFAILALCAATFVACADGVAPAGPGARPVPSFGFTNGPEDPGPIVLRSAGGDFFLLFNTDRASNLASLIRLPDPPDDVIPCGGTQPLAPADLQQVFHRNGVINQLLIGHQARAHLYERRSFVAAVRAGGICAAIASQVPLAEGLVDFIAHDNDTFFSGLHANAFGWSANGTLISAADGSQLRFLNESHGVLASDGSLVQVVDRITLTPVTVP